MVFNGESVKFMKFCKKCGFILGTRPGLGDIKRVCTACINARKKSDIDFEKRQNWLTKYIKENITHKKYDCIVAVSGGKDSHMIIKRLVENHGIKNILLITVCDEFTATQAGIHNRSNISEYFGFDHMIFRCSPKEFRKNTIKDFEESLNPLKWIEQRLYEIPTEMAKDLGIKLVFFGENSSYDYGNSEELGIFHPASDDNVKVIYMGAIYPYSIKDSLSEARQIGFKDLDDFCEWQRAGNIENYTQIDSIGYMVHIWCKFVKFGFQRVSDIACRFVREGNLTKEQAELYIKESDHILDPLAKKDFCKTLGITLEHFDNIVDKHANRELVAKDVNGVWRRK